MITYIYYIIQICRKNYLYDVWRKFELRSAKSVLFKMSFIIVIVLLFLFVSANTAKAEIEGLSEKVNSRLKDSISLYISSNKAYVGNKVIRIDPNDAEVFPVIKNNRTLLPLRFIVEKFGATVNWDESTAIVEVNLGDKTAKFKIGDNKMVVNGMEFLIDAKAETINSRTFIPLRSLAENFLGKKVFYYKGLIIISNQEKIFDESTETDLINEISDLIGSPLFLVKQNGKYGYIDRNGKIVIKPQYEYAGSFSEGLAFVYINGKLGYINRYGELAINNIFNDGFNFKEGLAAVEIERDNNSIWGFINKTGEFVIQPNFESVGNFSEDRAVFWKGNKSGVIDKKGNVIIEPKYDYIRDFKEDLAGISLNGKDGFIDKNGSIVIEPKYEFTGNFNGGLAPVCLDGKYGYVDKTGKFIIKPKFQDAIDFSEGMACVEIDNKWGFIDKTGEFVIQPRFEFGEFFSSFEEGLAIVQYMEGEDTKYGFIDRTGKLVIQPVFERTWGFKDGLAVVMKNTDMFDRNTEIGYIDKSGKYVWVPQK